MRSRFDCEDASACCVSVGGRQICEEMDGRIGQEVVNEIRQNGQDIIVGRS